MAEKKLSTRYNRLRVSISRCRFAARSDIHTAKNYLRIKGDGDSLNDFARSVQMDAITRPAFAKRGLRVSNEIYSPTWISPGSYPLYKSL